VLRSGAVKTYILAPSGTEQITGFFGPGDWVGLDAIGKGARSFCRHRIGPYSAMRDSIRGDR